MQRVKAVVRRFMLPITLIAGVTWALAFVYMFVALPRHGIGMALLLVLAGAVMSIPWIVMGLGVLQRMRASATADDSESGDARHP